MNPGPIVCFGNSLTEGYLVPRGFSYPAILRELTGRPVVNLGISGDTTGDGLRRLAEPISYELGIAIVEFGINDFLLGISLVTAARNLSSIIEGLKQGGAEVVLMGFHLQDRDSIKWQDMYAELAETYDLALIPDLFSGLRGCSSCFLADGLHPSSTGYRIIAENCLNCLIENRLMEPGHE